MVELKIEGEVAKLVNFGIADIRDEVLSGVENAVSHEMCRDQYLTALIQKMHLHTQEVAVSLASSSGLISVVEFPKMLEKELAEAVQFEAHKYVPVDMNDVALSWDVLSSGKKSKDEKSPTEKVLLVAALKKDVEKTANRIEKSGLDVSTMELEIFSLARALAGERLGTYLIIDVGFRVSNLVLVNNGDVRMNRNIDVGGQDMTKTIMDGMNISFDRAEALKKERDFFHQNEISLTFPSIDIILNEARRMMSLFSEQEVGIKIDSIILSGGTAMLPGFNLLCQEKLGIPAEMGDPWKRVTCDSKDFSADMKQELGSTLVIALGLALRGIEKNK